MFFLTILVLLSASYTLPTVANPEEISEGRSSQSRQRETPRSRERSAEIFGNGHRDHLDPIASSDEKVSTAFWTGPSSSLPTYHGNSHSDMSDRSRIFEPPSPPRQRSDKRDQINQWREGDWERFELPSSIRTHMDTAPPDPLSPKSIASSDVSLHRYRDLMTTMPHPIWRDSHAIDASGVRFQRSQSART